MGDPMTRGRANDFTPQVQSRVGENGRCFNACLATLLDVPEASVPDFPDDDDYEASIDRFLSRWGLRYVRVPVGVPPVGLHLVEGISPRGGMHAVVGRDGDIVWDPHPQDGTGRGLVRKHYYGLLIKR